MPDREKVIKGLTCCIYSEEECECPNDCPYEDDMNECQAKVMRDALALLKEQEIVRCRDCKFGEPWGVLIGCGTSKGFGITHNPDWYCADGVAKDINVPDKEGR